MKMKTNTKVKGVVMSAVIIASVFAMGAPAAASYNFDGYELKNMTNGTVQGDVFVSYGDHGGFPTTRTGVYRTNYTLPGGTVRWARLYVGIWGGTATRTGWVNTTLNASGTLHCLGNVTLNGTNDNNSIYSSGTNAYNTGCGCWMVSYNCTDNVTMNTINRAVATTGGQIDGRVYGIVLVVVYENTSLAKVQYWVNEGNVNLHYEGASSGGVTYSAVNNTLTWFNGTAYNSTEANLSVLYYTGDSPEHDWLYFNVPNASDSPHNFSNVSWNVTKYKRWQMDSNNVADESSGSAFDLDSFTSTNDSTALNNTVNTSAANSNYAIFWRGHDDDGDGVMRGNWTNPDPESEAYLHPILTVLKLKNITHVYDFSTRTPGTDAWAFKYQVGNSPGPSDPSEEFNATEYNNIKKDDTDSTINKTSTDTYYAAHRFNFSIDEAAPEMINVTWIGRGYHDSGASYNGVNLSIYNFSSGTYEQLNTTTLGTEVTLTGGVVVTTPSDYINSGNVTILVNQTSAHDWGAASHIETDYVRLVVTPDP